MTRDEREIFEERAAIAEFDGGLPRAKAEALARQELDRHRLEQRAEGEGIGA